MSSEGNFLNINDFKKWMQKQDEQSAQMEDNDNSIVGISVKSKINKRKLYERIDVEDGAIEELVADFRENGGTVVDVDGEHLMIEVESGSFYIPKKFVKKC